MPQKIEKSVIRILDAAGKTRGTGFFIAPGVAVTCAHVVVAAAGLKNDTIDAARGKAIMVRPRGSQKPYTAHVSGDGWSPINEGDVAFLRFTEIPENTQPVRLAYARASGGDRYAALGFRQDSGGARETWDRNVLSGLVEDQNGYTRLQLVGNQLRPGFSGAPVLDEKLDRVVGMVTWGSDGPLERVGLAVIVETIKALWPWQDLVIDTPEAILEEQQQQNPIIRWLGAASRKGGKGIKQFVFVPIVILFLFTAFALLKAAAPPWMYPVATATAAVTSTATTTVTPTATARATFAPTLNPAATIPPLPLPAATVTPTVTATPITACSFTGSTDFETISNLIEAEASASVLKDKAAIHAIFDRTADFYDYGVGPGEQPKFWPNPTSRYDNDLFISTNLRDARHYDIQQVGRTTDRDVAYFVSASYGERQSGAAWPTYQNGGKRTPPVTPFGSDHWTLKKNTQGCWVITQFDFNAGHIRFPQP